MTVSLQCCIKKLRRVSSVGSHFLVSLTDRSFAPAPRGTWPHALRSLKRRYQSRVDRRRSVRLKLLRCFLPVDSVSSCRGLEQSKASAPAARRALTGPASHACALRSTAADQPAPDSLSGPRE